MATYFDFSLKMTFHLNTLVSDSEVLGHLSVIDYECSVLSGISDGRIRVRVFLVMLDDI